MRMHNPPHPGEVLRDLCLEPLGISVTEAAKALGVARKTLSSILNGHSGISPEMAIRLGKAFDTTPESWLNQQMQYDLWQAEQHAVGLKVTKLIAAQQSPNPLLGAVEYNSPPRRLDTGLALVLKTRTRKDS